MTFDPLSELLHALDRGELALESVQKALESRAAEPAELPLDLDLDRSRRCGFPEVIYGPGKTVEVLEKAVSGLIAARQDVLVTRLDDSQFDFLAERFPAGISQRLARTWRCMQVADSPLDKTSSLPVPLPVAVVTAGTSDAAVAEEAIETLSWMRVEVRRVADVGVAGPHRLPARLESFRGCGAVIVVAGMEGALPSVVAGYVACPVIGVPTSVGYGANFGGLAALLSMLNSCAANVSVVNIDAGFKAGYIAGMIARRWST